MRESTGTGLRDNKVDYEIFKLLGDREDPAGTDVRYDEDVDGAVAKFMDYVRGPVQEWFTKRATFSALLETAREPAGVPWDTNPDPSLLRGTCVLCVLKQPGAGGRRAHAVVSRAGPIPPLGLPRECHRIRYRPARTIPRLRSRTARTPNGTCACRYPVVGLPGLQARDAAFSVDRGCGDRTLATHRPEDPRAGHGGGSCGDPFSVLRR